MRHLQETQANVVAFILQWRPSIDLSLIINQDIFNFPAFKILSVLISDIFNQVLKISTSNVKSYGKWLAPDEQFAFKHSRAAAISSHFGAMSEKNEVEVEVFDRVFNVPP